jgi:beta-aspartyl-peptidase (threonine type)
MNLYHQSERAHEWLLLLHGGAGAAGPEERQARQTRTLQEALARGADLLAAGRSAVDAVEASVRCLEESGDFNAGRGAVRDADGAVTSCSLASVPNASPRRRAIPRCRRQRRRVARIP